MEELFNNIVDIGAHHHLPWHMHETVMCRMVGLTPSKGVFMENRLTKLMTWAIKNRDCDFTVPNTTNFIVAII